ncbi:hypothetical protein K435DRAFT_394126 [Dendrothele bispora CBS 962.96]|uniref:Uncharacterized protein n=1 Tax=Dendrothele bispora (strain CBS 962.96) TaxID=1314807 RepID=A0A4S8L9V2_DENBC|nr:hypothetical protein K435DRAFT_394126 [Dendrothele bispora CBS 962.96]
MSQRRTRSQIQLVDNPFSFDRSPLKEARAASRIQSQPPDDSDVAMDRDLSSNRVSSANKRSPSPVHPSESNARAKRWKPDQDQNVDLTSLPPTYPRHYSDPNILPLQPRGRKRANTSSKPASAVQPTTRYLSPTTPPKKERARSVPLFSTVSIPAIDFRNPPKSPVRSPSRSPSKEILRIKPVSPIKETHDETEETAAEDSVTSRRVQDVPVDPIRTSSVESSANQADNTHSTSIETTFAMNDQPSTPTQSNAPSLPLSPLTPIPETPSFTRTTTHSNAEDGYTESWDLGPRSNETSKEFATHPQPTPDQGPSGALAKSRLPRPSGPSALKHTSSALLMPPPLPPPVASSSKLAPAHPKVTTTASKSTTTASMSQKPVKNAFSLLMSNAKANGKTAVVGGAGASVMAKSMKDKGKGKETPAVLPPPPQTSTSSTRPSVSTSKALKGKGKEKEVSVPPRLAGIKAKMKPREKPKEEAPPKLVFDSDEEEDEEMEQEKDGEDKGEERDRLVLTPTPIEPPVTSPLSPQTDLEPDPMDVVPYVEAETRDVESKGKGKEQEVEAEVEAEAEIEHEKRPELTRQSSLFSQPDIPDEPMVDAAQPDTEPAPDLSLRDSPMSEACSLFDDVDDVLKADYPMVVDGDNASVEVKSMETLPSSVEIAPEPIPAAVAAPILDTAPHPEPETELAPASLPLTKPKAKRQPSKKRVPSTFTGTSRVTRRIRFWGGSSR